MDILNWLYIRKQQLIKTEVNDASTDLLVLGAEVPFTTRDDGYQSYGMTVQSLIPLVYNKANVTQITNPTTPVTVNANSGIITTVVLTNAANAKTTFTVNNDVVTANSNILTSLNYDEAATGIPVVTISDLATGSFKVTIANTHSSAGLNALAKVSFLIID